MTIIAIATGAIALIVALLPVSFTTMTGLVGEETETTIPCGPALSAAFHRYPGCQDAASPYLIVAVLIAAAGAVWAAVEVAKKEK
ncbi:hypothetical protein ACWEN3_24020 [Streptomyces sp. NPDC004561]